MMRIAVCSGGIKIDGLKSQLNDKQINKTGKKILMTNMPNLRSVNKGAFF